MGGYGSSSPYRLVATWPTDSGAKVELLERDGRHWTRRRTRSGVVMVPVGRLLARDHREYAKAHGTVHGRLT